MNGLAVMIEQMVDVFGAASNQGLQLTDMVELLTLAKMACDVGFTHPDDVPRLVDMEATTPATMARWLAARQDQPVFAAV